MAAQNVHILGPNEIAHVFFPGCLDFTIIQWLDSYAVICVGAEILLLVRWEADRMNLLLEMQFISVYVNLIFVCFNKHGNLHEWVAPDLPHIHIQILTSML